MTYSGKSMTPIGHWLRLMHTNDSNHISSMTHSYKQESPLLSSTRGLPTSPMGGKPAQTIAALSVGGAEGRDTLPTTAPKSTNVSYVMVTGIPNMIAIAHTSTVDETESVGYQMTMHESPTNHIMPTYAHLDVKKDVNKGVMS